MAGKGRRIGKHQAVRQHRMTWYLRALDRLFIGEATPEEVAARARKLKEVK